MSNQTNPVSYSSPKNENRINMSMNQEYSSPSRFSSPKHFVQDTPKRYDNDPIERPYLPDCWFDDKRMQVLFSQFRIRDTNPEGWDLKMNFWINQINKWCLHQRKVTFTVEDIRKAFVRDDQFPHVDCIKLVVSHMKRNGKILFKEDLIKQKNSKLGFNFASWMFNSIIIKPISFGFNMLSIDRSDSGISNDDKTLPSITQETKLINPETLEVLCESVESHLSNMKTTCMRYANFLNLLNKSIFSEKQIDESSFDVIIDKLESQNKLKTCEDSGVKIVKFGKDNEIKETDITLVKLEATREILEAEATQIYNEMELIRNEAKVALENKLQDKALMLLKRKKRMEKKLKDKDSQIDNIDMIYEQLLETDSQQLLLKAFKLANDVLKKNSSRLEESENTVSQVEETLDDINILMAEINRPIGENAAIELDAEEELNQMLNDIESEKSQTSPNTIETGVLNQLDDLSIVDSDLSTESNKIKSKKERKQIEILES